MEKIAGIDLGTSTSCLALVVDGEPVVAPDSRGNRVTPSYIHIMDDGRILVGPQAKVEVISDPYSTIWATKRLIGRRYDDKEVQEAKKHFGFEILRAPDGGVLVRGRNKKLSPTEVGAIILKYLTRISKKALGYDIRKVVITVPAYFTDPQRKATMEAGSMIGLEVVRLINEPTAAALAYGYEHDIEQTIAIFDLGGGTFDLSFLSIGQGVFEVIATDGDSYLGGEDFDNRLVDFMVQDFKKKFEIDIYNDKMAHQRVKDACERAKIALSQKDEVEINLPSICPDLNRWAGVEAVITKSQYEKMVGDLVDRTVEVFKRLLKEVGMSATDLDNVVMVGGMTRMPLVRSRCAEFIGREPDTSMNPDEAVALGAAIHAASLSGEKLIKKPKSVPAELSAAEATRTGILPGIEKRAPGQPLSHDLSEMGAHPPLPPDEQGVTMPGIPASPDLTMPGVTSPGFLKEEPAPSPEPEVEAVAGPEPSELSEPPPPTGIDDFFVPEQGDLPEGEGEPEFPSAEEESEAEAIPLEAGEEIEEPEAPPAELMEEEAKAEEVEEEEPEPLLPADLKRMPEILESPEFSEEPPAPADEHPISAGPIIRDYETETEIDGQAELPVDPDLLSAAEAAAAELGVPAEEESAEPAGPEPGQEPAEPAAPAPSAVEPAKEEEPEYLPAPILLDVLSHSVGIAHFGGHFVPLIKRFAKLPARASQVFTTCVDNQQRIKISVLQGEGRYIKENVPLGEFMLTGIEKTKRGLPEVEVTFDIDPSGIFVISAKDRHTGAAKEIKLENWTGGAPDASAQAMEKA